VRRSDALLKALCGDRSTGTNHCPGRSTMFCPSASVPVTISLVKQLQRDLNWPKEWASLFYYDQLELWGPSDALGYSYAYRNRRERTLELAQRFAEPGGRVLDIAAGKGNFSLPLAEAGFRVTWNDLRAGLMDYVKLKWERGEIEFAPGNILQLEFPELFDLILMCEVIEHVAHPDQFLARAASLLKPGGRIVLTTPNGEYFLNDLPRFSDHPNPGEFEAVQFKPNSDGHIFLLHRDEIERLAAECGLETLHFQMLSNALTVGHCKTGLALKVLPRAVVFALERFSQALPNFLQTKVQTTSVVVLGKSKRT
jgi:2-polyprenyl-3-methyl-5-hydroxy-6-metoxy-1,4-benzoquinol methylase